MATLNLLKVLRAFKNVGEVLNSLSFGQKLVNSKLQAPTSLQVTLQVQTLNSSSCVKDGYLIYLVRAGAIQPIHWFLGGKGLSIQQGTSAWVGLPKSLMSV